MFPLILSTIGIILTAFILVAGARATFYGFRAVALGKRAIPASRHHEAPHKRVLVVGDSIAVGVGASTPEKSLVGRLISDYPHLHVDNLAQNAIGFGALEKTIASIVDETYDIVIISVGGMDVLQFTSCTSITKHIASIQKHIHRLGAQRTILVSVNNVGGAPMWGFPLSTYFDRRSRVLTKHIATLSATHNILHVPLYREKHEDPLTQNPNLFAEDGTHPNDQGYAIWYAYIQTIIHSHISS